MKFQAAISTLIAFCNALAIKRDDACTDPIVRKEWRSLTDTEKSDYIEAVQCLKTIPSRFSDTLSESLYDDFGYVHITLELSIHGTAVFLPWHRWFVQLYEEALQDECNYNGHALYWDWSLDYQDAASSPVFNTESGFGGNGDADSGCVVDGSFANWNVSVPDVHCLRRSFSIDSFEQYSDPSVVNDTIAVNGYAIFRPAVENAPHRSAHGGVGGDMLNNYSPNDPLFFLHHGNIDRIWWQWQNANTSRLSEYSGNRYRDDAATEATLEDEAPMVSGFVDEAPTVSDLMWVQTGRFCYTY